MFLGGTGGNPGDVKRGDDNVQRLIDSKIMKQWTQGDGSVMCSYRQITVAREEGVQLSSGTSKVCFVLTSWQPCCTIHLL